ncbi:MAG: hypothetical protein KF708_09955 [Pirellulales bacterium]|nr:hypothetical protein [Pirellulales bacterium]
MITSASLLLGITVGVAGWLPSSGEYLPQLTPGPLGWHTDYAQAMDEAQAQGKMLVVYFYQPGENAARDAFEAKTLGDPKVRALLQRYTRVRIPLDTVIRVNGQEVRLLEHESFREMLGRQGLAILDFAHWDSKFYGHVVSAFPFNQGLYYRPEPVRVMLDLPPGTITQRTMIYAVRMHPERPQSTIGEFNDVLREEAESHSAYQAEIRNQGHHSWESRFHRINGRIAANVPAQEVVAESWPGQSLVEACVECVRSWRQSSGHWGAVRSRHGLFGYDIKRGHNGVWYATGIFAGRR